MKTSNLVPDVPTVAARGRSIWRIAATAVIASLLGTTSAHAKLMGSDYVMMNIYGDWWVWKSPDGVCGAERTDSLGTTFSVATYSTTPNHMVVAVSNSSWQSLKPGQRYSILLSMDGTTQRLDSAVMAGLGSAKEPTLVGFVDIKSGLDTLSKNRSFSVSLEGRPLVHDTRVPLGAVRWIIECSVGSDDPFRAR